MRIDVFAHAIPRQLQRKGLEFRKSPADLMTWENLTTLVDVDLRLKIMDEHQMDMQVVSTAGPPLESVFETEEALELATIANDTMAELVAQHPDRLRGIATIPLLDVQWAIAELHRSVRELGLLGPLMYTSVRGRPLDSPELDVFYAEVEHLNVPIWLHPERSGRQPDYPGERTSKFGLGLLFGWPFETSIAMARLVYSGMLLRHDRLRIICHHAGAMIPFFAKRIEMHEPHERDSQSIGDEIAGPDIPHLDQFSRFYVDTVTQGSVSALMGAYQVFGADHMLLGSDMPFGPGMGRRFAQVSVEAVEWMPIPEVEKEKIRSGNVARLTGLRVDS